MHVKGVVQVNKTSETDLIVVLSTILPDISIDVNSSYLIVHSKINCLHFTKMILLRLNSLNKHSQSLSILSSSLCLFSSSLSAGSDEIKQEIDVDDGKYYGEATTDTAFKHMLSPTLENKQILTSFLNCFVPDFQDNQIQEITEIPNAIPTLKVSGGKQKIMDLHVVSEKGLHYIIQMQARRRTQFDECGLFYATSIYSQQLRGSDLQSKKWYEYLKPVIALHSLDYDTKSVHVLGEDSDDEYVKSVRQFPMKEDQFIKHYLLTDALSGQKK